MGNVLHAPAQRRAGNRTATLAACVLAAFALLAVVAAGIALYGQATVTDFTAKNLAPSLEQPAIGVILSESMSYLSTGAWWLAVFPGLALMATVLLFDVAGQSLRKLVDPHTAQT